MKFSKNIYKISGAAAVALLALACGRAADPTPVTVASPSVSCPSGQVPGPNNVCMQPAASIQDFASACYGVYGLFDPNAKTCTFSVSQWVTIVPPGYPTGPTLTPDQPTGPYALKTQVPVKVGDQVSVSYVSGNYGTNAPDNHSYLGGLFTVTTWNTGSSSCAQVDMNGVGGGAQGTNGGLPAGLVGSDGSKVFFLGTGGSATVATNGKLLLGINVPSNTSYLCGGFSATVTVKTN